jgi:hypothetical protein
MNYSLLHKEAPASPQAKNTKAKRENKIHQPPAAMQAAGFVLSVWKWCFQAAGDFCKISCSFQKSFPLVIPA